MLLKTYSEGKKMEEGPGGLENILADIGEQTGVRARSAPQGGDETAFTVLWNGGTVTLYLAGNGEVAEREAKLIRYLLANSSCSPARGGKVKLDSVLLGEAGRIQAFRYLAEHNLKDGPCFAAQVIPDRRGKDALEHIGSCLDGGDAAVFTEGGRIGVVKFSGDGQPPFEFGQFLNRSLYEEAGIRAKVGVGCEVSTFAELSLSYAQAVSALRMSEMLGDRGEVHSYSEYLLVGVLSALPRESIRKTLKEFRIGGTEEVFCDGELILTAETFFEKDLNLSETSRALFVHRNTLLYRLDKIERLTGLDIRKFSDAVTFRVIAVLLKLVKE